MKRDARGSRRAVGRRARPWAEALEDRRLLATAAPADYDGDGRSDFAAVAFDASRAAQVFAVDLSGGGSTGSTFGGALDRPISGDYNGDGKADVAVYGYSPDNGYSRFAILPSGGGPAILQPFGGADDVPVSGDFDGDGKTDIAVYGYSPDQGISRFAVLPSGGPSAAFPGGATSIPLGGAGDVPVVGDFDGDGKDDLGVYGPGPVAGTSRFAIRLSGGPSADHPDGTLVVTFGGLGDTPAVGDYDGDGKADVAVYGYSADEGFSRFGILDSSTGSGAVDPVRRAGRPAGRGRLRRRRHDRYRRLRLQPRRRCRPVRGPALGRRSGVPPPARDRRLDRPARPVADPGPGRRPSRRQHQRQRQRQRPARSRSTGSTAAGPATASRRASVR